MASNAEFITMTQKSAQKNKGVGWNTSLWLALTDDKSGTARATDCDDRVQPDPTGNWGCFNLNFECHGETTVSGRMVFTLLTFSWDQNTINANVVVRSSVPCMLIHGIICIIFQMWDFAQSQSPSYCNSIWEAAKSGIHRFSKPHTFLTLPHSSWGEPSTLSLNRSGWPTDTRAACLPLVNKRMLQSSRLFWIGYFVNSCHGLRLSAPYQIHTTFWRFKP